MMCQLIQYKVCKQDNSYSQCQHALTIASASRNTFTQSSIAYTVELTLYNTVQSVTLRSGVIGDTPPTDNSNVIAYLFGPSNESPTGV